MSDENIGCDPSVAGGNEESAAIFILKQAIDMDKGSRKLEALTLYREGIQLLFDHMRNLPDDSAKKRGIRSRVEDYMNRAEILKNSIESDKKKGKFHQQIRVAADSSGYSYDRIFGPLVDMDLTAVQVEDPYIRKPYQLLNFVRFCEVLVKRGANRIRKINLVTSSDSDTENEQRRAFNDLKASLKKHNILLSVTYSDSLHDREIRFNNGWVVKIGRGLDYFKGMPSNYSIGFCDMDLRACHETNIDIFFKSATASTHPSGSG